MGYVENPPLNELYHYGTPRCSGRYPWGSGDNPYQRTGDFLARIDELKKQGLNQKEIAKSFGLTTTQFRTQRTLAKDERRAELLSSVKSMKEDGLGWTEIGNKLGIPESTARSLMNEQAEARMNAAKATADFLRDQIESTGKMIDVGTGVEKELNVSREKMREAIYILEMEGYESFTGGVPQVTNQGKQTNTTVIFDPKKYQKKDFYNFENIQSVRDYVTSNDGETFHKKFVYPESMDSKRLSICYKEDGGIDKDGVMEIRRGVPDLDLGKSTYAQVRILVDGDKYLKGMAVYSDDLPDGVDVRFNTNKSKDVAKMDVLKAVKRDKDGNIDQDNPFGSLIKEGGQSYYIGKDGKEHLSLINKRAEEGDWGEWANKVPSQFLAKQNKDLVKRQLKLATEDKLIEFEEINSLTNPTVKKAMLKTFADECDGAAQDLKAAALPRQRYHVILPVPSLKDTEIYAPNYKNGEQVALVRYPHGGTFEIPILTVNNKQRDSKKMLGNAVDAVCINSKVAEQLSGADFDGDTVMVIPTGGKVRISSSKPLKGLEGFDPKMEYPARPGMKVMTKGNTQREMGSISNLITDMTIKGATPDELARAVRHSMVVIDAEKHHLDYKKSEKDNGIPALKKYYQGHYDEDGSYHEGASTILSLAKSDVSVPKRQGTPKVNKKGEEWYDPTKPEGAHVWKEADDLYYTNYKTGKTEMRTQKSSRMAETDDARTLVSDAAHPVEEAYASYANGMKDLANRARKEMVYTGRIAINKQAKVWYKKEIDSLDAKLNIALRNAPRERQAQTIANARAQAKLEAYPDMTKKEQKKIAQQELTRARILVGAKKVPIVIEDREWEAIQEGAIAESKLMQIINNADQDLLKQRAMPRATSQLSTAKINKIAHMNSVGYTTEEIAKSLGVSTSTVTKYLK